MAVGITETVPGVSGSTVAMILGIYERLIYSLSILTTKHRKQALPFLFTFGTGMVIGFAISRECKLNCEVRAVRSLTYTV
ncbi:undecaprenyl phosphate translocase family protein [Oceanobacillus saliphilus]|uniref:undecaprenyl phosphate translocase family protein n=1 Tax=Oceanobacillus saliphilus TaxID=2925834 RepID=UPI0027D27CE0|nr:DUF368 domain-containing protein [Oceanobacillus saliphilus]